MVTILFLAVPAYSSAATVVILTSGSTWTVPSNVKVLTLVEVIGGGGGGTRGPGGGGGAYSSIANLSVTPNASISISIGTGGSGAPGGPGGVGGDTWFSSSGTVLAKGGAGTTDLSMTGGAGGAASSGVGATKYSGGTGAGATDTTACGSFGAFSGGGGGGAAGAHGNGNNGSTGAGNAFNGAGIVNGGPGGSGDAGSGGAGGSPNGGAGGNTTNGGGGGGAGGFADYNTNGSAGGGGPGGNYGAGGGGGGQECGAGLDGTGGSGKQGVIVITYTPSANRNITMSVPVSVAGNVSVLDNLSKGSGTFLIDDPIDPANKLLYHSFVESPDALNEYAGTSIIGANGEATIKLPDYFEALNGNYQYFVRPVDKPMPNLHIKQEVQDNVFVVGGGAPGGEVSWMVTGVRHDPYILAHPIVPEVEKGPGQLVDKGQYLFQGNAPACPTLIGCVWNFLKNLF